jgi:hypothetical protein
MFLAARSESIEMAAPFDAAPAGRPRFLPRLPFGFLYFTALIRLSETLMPSFASASLISFALAFAFLAR